MLTVTIGEILHSKNISIEFYPFGADVLFRDEPFLPEGFWPHSEAGAGAEVVRDTTSVGPTQDLERFSFLLGFKPLMRIVIEGEIGRGYEAFIVRANSGRQVALVERPLTSNALYVFDAERRNWESVARRTRWQIITEKPKAFMGRFFHNNSFKERVVEFLLTH